MTSQNLTQYHIAILIPCYNETKTIKQVVKNFQSVVPHALIYVYDNNSTDATFTEALAAGAIVRKVKLQGKGNVVRRMFADVEADIYIMVDGDATYDASMAPKLIDTLLAGPNDMVNAARVNQEKEAYRFGHVFGNKLLTSLVTKIFGKNLTDMLSGYRAFSRRFVKSFPCNAKAFEIETELTIHALALRLPVEEIQTNYFARPEGSFSKLSTYKDGFYILGAIASLIKKEKSLLFFNVVAFISIAFAMILSFPVFLEFLKTGLVPRFPTWILSVGLSVVATLSVVCGIILDTLATSRREAMHLKYLSYPALTLSDPVILQNADVMPAKAGIQAFK